MMAQVRLGVAGLLVTALLVACGQQRPTVALTLADLSCSTFEGAIRSDYLDAFEMTLGAVEDGGVALLTGIDDNSVTNRRFAISETFAPADTWDGNPLTHERKIRQQMAQVRKRAQALLDTRSETCETDIFGGLQLAAWALASYPDADKRYLMICSDMVPRIEELMFSETDLTPEVTSEIIETHRREGRLPDLTGVQAWVVGAGVRVGGPLPPDRYQELKVFWLSYLQAAGATISANRYGPVPVRFP